MTVESQRTRRRATERALCSSIPTEEDTVEGSCIATVINAELMQPECNLNINANF